MADSDFDKITPADIKLSGKPQPPEETPEAGLQPLGVEEIRRSDEEKKKHTKILAGIFFLLLVLVGGVVFVLPEFISPPDPASSSVVVVSPQTQGAAPANEVSPFQEAQKLRQREAAQNVLAELLDLQESLEEKEVSTWAPEQIEEVFALASQGDEAYREQEFVTARELYEEGQAILQALDADLPNVFERYMAAGAQAILDDVSLLAEESFGIAVLINPDSSAAVTGYDRAQILDQVLPFVEEGRILHEQSLF